MASGTDTRQRTGQILVRLTDEELAAIDAKADRAGIARAAFMRAAALGAIGPRAQRRPPADHVALRQLLGELGRIGNNLNQLARAGNAGLDVDSDALKAGIAAVLECRARILTALNMKPAPLTTKKPAAQRPPPRSAKKRSP